MASVDAKLYIDGLDILSEILKNHEERIKALEKGSYEQITKEVADRMQEPTFKEAMEHMKSEFNATGKDVKIFMENKIKYGGLLGKETVDFMNGEGKYADEEV